MIFYKSRRPSFYRLLRPAFEASFETKALFPPCPDSFVGAGFNTFTAMGGPLHFRFPFAAPRLSASTPLYRRYTRPPVRSRLPRMDSLFTGVTPDPRRLYPRLLHLASRGSKKAFRCLAMRAKSTSPGPLWGHPLFVPSCQILCPQRTTFGQKCSGPFTPAKPNLPFHSCKSFHHPGPIVIYGAPVSIIMF